MGWPRRETEEKGVQEKLLNSGNARNQKIIKVMAVKYPGRGSRQAAISFFDGLAITPLFERLLEDLLSKLCRRF